MLSGVFHLHEQQARQVMTPIPAVVTVDVVGERRDRAAALRRLRPHAAGRHRGRQHRPHQRHRARELARAAADERGPGRVGRGEREGCPDRPRDQAARRPAWPTSSASARRSPWWSTSTAAPPGSCSVEDIIEEVVGEIADETDPAVGRHPPAGERRLVGARPRADHRPRRLRARPAGGLGRLQLGRRVRLRRARAPAQARRHGSRERLLAARGVGAREPDRGGAHPRPRRADRQRAAPRRAATRGRRGVDAARPAAAETGP